MSGAHQMELPSPLTSWVNPFPSRIINRTIFFCNALESHECACCLLSFLYFHWLFPLLACETSSGNRFICKSTRERVDSKGLCGRWRLPDGLLIMSVPREQFHSRRCLLAFGSRVCGCCIRRWNDTEPEKRLLGTPVERRVLSLSLWKV